ncbi:MAG: sigma 54 modulation/S30EA ribosomal C-terminal domain-containing protein [Acidimicrobiales bacterium]
MPDGHTQWIDDRNDLVHIVRHGREFTAAIGEVESRARVPGARVHFDVNRKAGLVRAKNVTLAAGTRTNRRHRRFGDLTGARAPGAKVATTASRNLGVDVTTQPMKVVRTWVETMTTDAIDDALSLYSPDAVINTEDASLRGRAQLHGFLTAYQCRDISIDEVMITGLDQLVRVDWPSSSTVSGPSWFQIDHGHITEQWDRLDPTDDDEIDEVTPIEIVSVQPLGASDDAMVRERFARLCGATTVGARSARIKLDVLDRTGHKTISATAALDLGDRLVRAQETGERLPDVIDTLCLRIRRQTREIAERRADRNRGRVGTHNAPDTIRTRQARPPHLDVPPDERTLVRHKTYAPTPSTIEEAEFDRQSLDYDFFLFEEVSTGSDHVLVADEDLELRSLDGTTAFDALDHVDRVIATAAPALSVAQALARLTDGHEQVVFFRNCHTDRGNVVYRRFDGHYGLITPD